MSSENQIAHRKDDCDLLVQTGHVYNFAEIDVTQNLSRASRGGYLFL